MSVHVSVCLSVCVCLSKKNLFNGCTYQKMLVYEVVTFLKRIKMAILFLDFFGSDPSKMDQTRKFGEQTSRILVFLYTYCILLSKQAMFTYL